MSPAEKSLDHARDAAERGRLEDVLYQHIDELVFAVGPPLPRLVARDEARVLDQGARVELDLVRHERRAAHELAVVLDILIRRRAVEVDHEVRVSLETEDAEIREGTRDLLHVDAAFVGTQHLRAQALHADLHLGAPELPEEPEPPRRDGIGARLDDEPDHAMCRRLVDSVLLEKLRKRRLLG